MCRRKRSCALSLAAIFSLTAIPAAQRNVWNGRSADSPARIYAAESCADSLAAGGEETSVSAERMPRFCGGDINDFRRWLQAQVVMPPEMPDSCEQGTVVARFVVEKDGTPSQIEIVRSPSDALSREAMRVIGTSPAWETCSVGERPVRVRMYVSFRFRVEKPAPPSPQVPAAIIPDTVAESIRATHSASDVTMPTFRGGGMEKFREWFMDELEYPVGAYHRDLTGRSSVQFVVGKDGSLGGITLLEASDEMFDETVIACWKSARHGSPQAWTESRSVCVSRCSSNSACRRRDPTVPAPRNGRAGGDGRTPESGGAENTGPGCL